MSSWKKSGWWLVSRWLRHQGKFYSHIILCCIWIWKNYETFVLPNTVPDIHWRKLFLYSWRLWGMSGPFLQFGLEYYWLLRDKDHNSLVLYILYLAHDLMYKRFSATLKEWKTSSRGGGRTSTGQREQWILRTNKYAHQNWRSSTNTSSKARSSN